MGIAMRWNEDGAFVVNLEDWTWTELLDTAEVMAAMLDEGPERVPVIVIAQEPPRFPLVGLRSEVNSHPLFTHPNIYTRINVGWAEAGINCGQYADSFEEALRLTAA